jgi:OPA family glycerol-3-phosphate transporter-like MFS transporter 1/2
MKLNFNNGSGSLLDGDNYAAMFGSLDSAFLFTYAVGVFISGHIAERVNIRYFLTAGMILTGIFTALFGLAEYWNIHSLTYFIVIQVLIFYE